MRPQHLFAILLGLIVASFASSAHAHCRKTTAGADESYDAAITGTCAGEARSLPLYWRETCIALRVVVDPELEAKGKMTQARATDIVQRATADWATVQCKGRGGTTQPLAIRVVDVAREQCAAGAATTRNEVHFTTTPPQGDGLLAVTKITYDAVNGVMSSASMQLLDIYAGLGASPASDRDDEVERVVRHEMGHFLGLAHSNDARAVMYAGYDTKRIDGLTEDDVSGICDVYAADRPIGEGCSVGPRPETGNGTAWLAIAVGLSLALRGRRSRALRVGMLVVALIVTQSTIVRAEEPRSGARAWSPARSNAKRGAPKRPAAGPTKPTRAAPSRAALSPQDASLLERQEDLARVPEAGAAPYRVASLSAASIPVSPADTSDARETPSSAPPIMHDAPATPAAPAPTSSDLYLGARYRALFMPKALVGLVGTSNEDLLFHSVSLEADLHGKRFSVVPALTFADLSTKDLLLGSRSSDLASSFSYVRSDLKAVAASVGLVWSAPISRVVDFELGLELGLGVTFGSLVDSWVYESANGPLAYGGRRFAPCQTVNDGFGCRPQDHGSPTPVRVGSYKEPSFVDGGKAPTILPWVSLPLVGVRARLGDDLAARVGIGASLTGIWAGVSLDYAVAKADRR